MTDYIGFDFIPEFIAIARKNYPEYHFEVIDIKQRLPFQDQEFGIAIGISFKQIFITGAGEEEWSKALKELRRAARKVFLLPYGNNNPEEIYKTMQKPKVSVVIPFFESDPGKAALLKCCVDSLSGYDELIIMWNEGTGMTRALNRGFELSKGDFIIVASDDIVVVKGNLRMLCDPNAVVSPMTNGKKQDFWGTMWCTPRKIYEQIGFCFDPRYADGINYEDTDLWEEMKTRKIPHYCNDQVDLYHPEPGRTLNIMPEKQRRVERNRNLFIEKWGYEV